MQSTTIKFKTRRGTPRSINIETSGISGINVSATGEIEPEVARHLAHALLFLADQVDQQRRLFAEDVGNIGPNTESEAR